MNSLPTPLTLAARFPGLRTLAWSGRDLYASRGYELLRARLEDARDITWQPVAHFRPSLRRRLSVANRFDARLFRDGFHALAHLPSGAIIGAVPGSIVTVGPGESQFRQTHAINRGTRPLHITATPGGAVFWGEYFDNAQRDEVHIYGSLEKGATWSIAYTFSRDTIRHVHIEEPSAWMNHQKESHSGNRNRRSKFSHGASCAIHSIYGNGIVQVVGHIGKLAARMHRNPARKPARRKWRPGNLRKHSRSTLYSEMLFDPKFVAYKKFPEGVTARDSGSIPVATGDPATGVNAPLDELME